MSSLPSISHHLFVAAAGQDERARRKPARPEPSPGGHGGSPGGGPPTVLKRTGRRDLQSPNPYRLAALLGET